MPKYRGTRVQFPPPPLPGFAGCRMMMRTLAKPGFFHARPWTVAARRAPLRARAAPLSAPLLRRRFPRLLWPAQSRRRSRQRSAASPRLAYCPTTSPQRPAGIAGPGPFRNSPASNATSAARVPGRRGEQLFPACGPQVGVCPAGRALGASPIFFGHDVLGPFGGFVPSGF